MIRFLRGKILFQDLQTLCLDVNGVGYGLRMPINELAGLCEVGKELQVHVHTHVREQSFELFAFQKLESMRMFERLMTISGVGPKSALGILSGFSLVQELVEAVVNEDEKKIQSAPGVGKKTAARIILELKDKLMKEGLLVPEGDLFYQAKPDKLADLESALGNLGYRQAQIQKALKAVKPMLKDDPSLEELVLEALSKF